MTSVNEGVTEGAVCEACGMGVRISDESDEGEPGRVVCEGCGRPTDLCSCVTGDPSPTINPGAASRSTGAPESQ